MRLILTFLFPLLISMLFVSCASGPGVNRHVFFDQNPSLILPFEIEVDNETKSMKTGAMMGEGSEFQAFVVGGLPALALLKTPGAVGGIRGKFAVGEVFERCAKSLSIGNSQKKLDILNLKLIFFQQYLISGLSPRMKALMKFRANLQNSNEIIYSVYAFNWEGQGMVLSPGEEKNMLNEMVEQSLFHWAKVFLSSLSKCDTSVKFPSQDKGEFTGKGVKCTYEIFAKP